MKRTEVLGTVLVTAATALYSAPATAQVTVGADLGTFSGYVWRGLSLTNRPVAEPDIYITIPVGEAGLTFGGWANIDVGQYDGTGDFSESGGTSSFNLSEFDPWAELSYPLGKATFTGGVNGYVFPNAAVFTSDFNTLEVYGKLALAVPLNPKLAAWYDVDKVKGLYGEASISHPLPLAEGVSLTLGALAGFNAGQHADLDGAGSPQVDFFNFADKGFTHLDLSAALPVTTGLFTIAPVLHVVVGGDELTRFTRPGETHDLKLWFGGVISWSRKLGETPAEEAEPTSGAQ